MGDTKKEVDLRGFNYGEDDTRVDEGDPIPDDLDPKARRLLVEAGCIAPDETPREELLKLTRPKLNAKAVELGVAEPEKLGSKDDVADAIEELLGRATREELNDLAEDAGVRQPEELANKDEVSDEIERSDD